MLIQILAGGAVATFGGFVGFIISKKITNANFDIYVEKAKAKASAIENEAHTLLNRANIKSKEIELEATRKFESVKQRAKEDLHQREDDVIRKEQNFKRYKQNEEKRLHDDGVVLKAKKVDLQRNEKSLNSLKIKYEKKVDEALHAVEHSAGMTVDEAKTLLLEKIEEKYRADIAHMVRRNENEEKKEAEKKETYILAQATSRYAGEFASERLTNIVHLNDDELTGRIIGKEGRNIKALETL